MWSSSHTSPIVWAVSTTLFVPQAGDIIGIYSTLCSLEYRCCWRHHMNGSGCWTVIFALYQVNGLSVETECKTVNDSTSDMEVEVIIQQVQRCNKPAMKPSTCFKNLKTTSNNDNYYNNWILFRGIQYGFSEAPEKIKSGESWAKKKKEIIKRISTLLLTLKIALAQNYPSM